MRFADDTVTVTGIIEACETLSMFSERRVIVVSDFAPLEGARLKGFSDDDEAHLAEYIKDIPESAVLIFTCVIPDRRESFIKHAARLELCTSLIRCQKAILLNL